MAKTESTFKNMVLSLSLISTGFAICLGLVYGVTKEPIEQSAINKKIAAISQVVPEFDNDPNSEMFQMATPEGDSLDIYPAKNGEEIIAYAVNTYTMNGFSGQIDLMVGFDAEGSIIDINVLDHSETPGLGSKMTDPTFKDQFKGVDPSTFSLGVKKDGGDVDAITAATISSRAFGDAVQRAYKTLFPNGPDAYTGATSDTTATSGTTAISDTTTINQ